MSLGTIPGISLTQLTPVISPAVISAASVTAAMWVDQMDTSMVGLMVLMLAVEKDVVMGELKVL